MSLPALWISEIPRVVPTGWEQLLGPEEQERLLGISAPERRLQFMAARILLRKALADEFQIPETNFKITALAGETPRVLNAPKAIRVSLSHTPWACAALIAETACGVDIEDSSRERDFAALAKQAFEGDALAEFESSPGRENFYALWTAKEAGYKSGKGGDISTLRYKHYQIAVALPASLPGLKKIVIC